MGNARNVAKVVAADGDVAAEVAEVADGTVGIMKAIKGCKSPQCILKLGVFGGLFKIFGNSLDSAEAQKAMKYSEWTIGVYMNSKKVLGIPKIIKGFFGAAIKNLPKTAGKSAQLA